MKKLLAICLLAAGLGSCDCLLVSEITVLDRSTGKPVQGASLYEYDEATELKTDSTGKISTHRIISGFICSMPVRLEKEGYKTRKFRLCRSNKLVYMRRKK